MTGVNRFHFLAALMLGLAILYGWIAFDVASASAVIFATTGLMVPIALILALLFGVVAFNTSKDNR